MGGSYKSGIGALIAIHMVIAVEDGLENLTSELRARGYTVVHYPEYGGVVDAFIYKDDMIQSMAQYQNSFTTDSLENSNSSYGVLVVNANNKSVEQIEAILQKRLYSPLF